MSASHAHVILSGAKDLCGPGRDQGLVGAKEVVIEESQIERLQAAMEAYCIRRSDTPMKLTSGGTTYYYYNGKAVTLRPSLVRTIGRMMLP